MKTRKLRGRGTVVMDVEALLAPVSDDAPTGADLEYEPAFGEIERASRGKEAHDMGDEVVEAEPADWGAVVRGSIDLFAETKDLRLGVLLARGRLHQEGFPGLAASLQLLLGLVTRFWEDVHPQLDPEDGNDPTLRANVLAGLADELTTLREIANAPMITVRGFGSVTYRALLIANGSVTPLDGEEAMDSASVNGCLMDCDMDDLRGLSAAINESLDLARALQTEFDERAGGSNLNLEQLFKVLDGAAKEIGEYLVKRGDVIDTGEESADSDSAGSPMGAINNREQALAALDKAIAYFRGAEPSSPVPLLLQRAKRLATMDFLEIVKDLAPDGFSQVRNVGGLDGGASEDDY